MNIINVVRQNEEEIRKLYQDAIVNPVDMPITNTVAEMGRLAAIQHYREIGSPIEVNIDKMFESDDEEVITTQLYNMYILLPESTSVHNYSGFFTICEILEGE